MRTGIISNSEFVEMYWRVFRKFCSVTHNYWANYISNPSLVDYVEWKLVREKYFRLADIRNERMRRYWEKLYGK